MLTFVGCSGQVLLEVEKVASFRTPPERVDDAGHDLTAAT